MSKDVVEKDSFTVVNKSDIPDMGAFAYGNGLFVRFHTGPMKVEDKKLPQNGAFVETLISVAKERLLYFQDNKYACVENDRAIRYLQYALDELASRTRRREDAGIAGTHELDQVVDSHRGMIFGPINPDVSYGC